jgi:hypothetical protein
MNLTRQITKCCCPWQVNQELADRGVEVHTVDYSSVPSLTKALSGVDVIISFVAELDNSNSQLNLFQAAEATGVKRFIPSEWAMDVQRYAAAAIQCKSLVVDLIYTLQGSMTALLSMNSKRSFDIFSPAKIRSSIL